MYIYKTHDIKIFTLIFLFLSFICCKQNKIKTLPPNSFDSQKSKPQLITNFTVFDPIHWAVDFGAIEDEIINIKGQDHKVMGIKTLAGLNTNWNSRSRNKSQFTPLYMLCEKGDHKTLKAFFKYGSNVDINFQGRDIGLTALSIAVNNKNRNCFELLLNQNNINLDIYYNDFASPLYFAIKEDNEYAFDKLVKNGADVNYYVVMKKYTLLHMCVYLIETISDFEKEAKKKNKISDSEILYCRYQKLLKYLTKLTSLPKIDINKPTKNSPGYEMPIFLLCKHICQKPDFLIYYLMLKHLKSIERIVLHPFVQQVLKLTSKVMDNKHVTDLKKPFSLDKELKKDLFLLYTQNSNNNINLTTIKNLSNESSHKTSIVRHKLKKSSKISGTLLKEEKYSDEDELKDKYNTIGINENLLNIYEDNIYKDKKSKQIPTFVNAVDSLGRRYKDNNVKVGQGTVVDGVHTLKNHIYSYVLSRVKFPTEFSIFLDHKLLIISILVVGLFWITNRLKPIILIAFVVFLMLKIIASLINYDLKDLGSKNLNTKLKVFEKILNKIPKIKNDEKLKKILLKFLKEFSEYLG